MTGKYTKKDFMENIRTLTSPFEKVKQNGQGKGLIPDLAEMVQEIANRNKGMTPK